MSTFYLDFVLGDNTKDGTSWAKAWKTLTAGPTAARCAPGDTIMIAKTPDEVSLGTDVAMTVGSTTCTLTTAKTANVTLCENAWTSDGGANVECDTTSPLNNGSYSVRNKVKGAFVTGLAAHFQISDTNFSVYQKLSFCFRTNVQIAANSLRIDLCSDTAGASAVDSFTISNILLADRVYSLTIDKAAALGSSIKSVAMVVLSDLGGSDVTILLDNIIAANSLHLQSVIGKTGGQWMAIRAIDGTTITMGKKPYFGGWTNSAWYAETESFAAYVRECAPVESLASSSGDLIIQEAGTETAPYLYKGGINRANDSQDGHTFLIPFSNSDSYGANNNGIIILSYCEFENISGAGFSYVFSITHGACGGRWKNFNMASCDQAWGLSSYSNAGFRFEGTWKWTGCGQPISITGLDSSTCAGGITSDADLYIWNCYEYSTSQYFKGNDIYWTGKIVLNNGNRNNQYDYAIQFNLRGNNFINELSVSGANTAIRMNEGEIEIGKVTISAACLKVVGAESGTRLRVGNYILSGGSPTEVEWNAVNDYSNNGYLDSVSFDRYKADNRYKQLSRRGIISDHVTGGQAAGWAYGGTGLSLLLNPNSRRYPLIHSFWIPVGTVAGQQLSMQVIKDSAGANCTLKATIQGCGVDIVEESVTLSDAWAEYQSTAFTPTFNGFIKVILYILDGSSSGDIGIDDIKVLIPA